MDRICQHIAKNLRWSSSLVLFKEPTLFPGQLKKQRRCSEEKVMRMHHVLIRLRRGAWTLVTMKVWLLGKQINYVATWQWPARDKCGPNQCKSPFQLEQWVSPWVCERLMLNSLSGGLCLGCCRQLPFLCPGNGWARVWMFHGSLGCRCAFTTISSSRSLSGHRSQVGTEFIHSNTLLYLCFVFSLIHLLTHFCLNLNISHTLKSKYLKPVCYIIISNMNVVDMLATCVRPALNYHAIRQKLDWLALIWDSGMPAAE